MKEKNRLRDRLSKDSHVRSRSHVNLDKQLGFAEAVILPHLSYAGEEITRLELVGL